MDILSRLPIKDLFHCRCVCKRFLCFTYDREFSCLHLSRSPVSILVNSKPVAKTLTRLRLFQVDADGESFQVSKLNFTKSIMPSSGMSDVSACNGLLCLSSNLKGRPSYVCNPILGEFITIQPPYKDRYRNSFWGLGYSNVTNQYKLLLCFIAEGRWATSYSTAEIYTIGTGTWRSIGNPPTDLVSLPFDAFLNGNLHWLSNKDSKGIHSFDIDAEKFGTVPTPHHFQDLGKFDYYMTIGVLRGCLFVNAYTFPMQFDIWVMKEYGVKESWTRPFVVQDLFKICKGFYIPIVVLSNGDILISDSCNSIVCYDQKRKQLRETKFCGIRSHFDAVGYAPCFVSLYDVAQGEQISRMQNSIVYDKILKEELIRL